MKVHALAARCPVCAGALEVAQAWCPACEVSVQGRFHLLEFNRLSAPELLLLRLFIRARGNLKELARVLGVSYPTARARFEELLQALGYEGQPSAEEARGEREAVLDALEAGQISAVEATRRLQALRRP